MMFDVNETILLVVTKWYGDEEDVGFCSFTRRQMSCEGVCI